MSINLLPWRQLRRKRQYKKFIYRIAVYVICLFLLSLITKLFFYIKLEKTHSKMILLNHQLSTITFHDPTHANKLLLLKLIYFHAQQPSVRQQNNTIQNDLFHIANVIPNSMILDKLSIDPKKIVLIGKSDQLADIHRYLDALQSEKIGKSVQLADIQTDQKNHSNRRFTIEIFREAQQHEK